MTSFQKARDPENSLSQAAYMKNLFPFLGIKAPMRAALQKEVFKNHPIQNEKDLFEIANKLFALPEREYTYAALDLMQKHRKLITDLDSIRVLITTRSWWDSVDLLASNVLGHFLERNPSHLPIMDGWIIDKNLWIRRSALLYQLKWKEKTDYERLFSYSLKCAHDDNFFIRKAIGWALRQYSKTDSSRVFAFIEKHRGQLSPLSIREGSKYLDR